MDQKEFLIKMSNATGVSGHESERAKIVMDEFAPLCDDVSVDTHGNVICLKKGKGKGKIMFAAHVDEIGLIVTHIDDNGFIRLAPIGGFDQRALVAQEVIIHGREKVFGVIGIKPPHLIAPDEARKAVKLEDLTVDTGYPAEKLKSLVSVGDIVTVNRQVVSLLGNRLAGKAFDDSAGIAALAYAIEYLKDFSHDADVYFVATSQEEVGGRGSATATYTIMPDIGIAVDVSFAKTPDLGEDNTCEFGKGPQIASGPNSNRRVYERLKESAQTGNIKYQTTVIPKMSGTDARCIQIAGCGVASGVVSIPLKYMHTSVELITMDDIDATGRLLASFVMSFNNCDMEEFLCL